MEIDKPLTDAEALALWRAQHAKKRYRNPKQAKSKKREDLGGKYFRSAMEANLYRWFTYLKNLGAIDYFEYEPKPAFVFSAQPDRRVNGKKAPLRGISFGKGMRYLPDFKVKWVTDADVTYVESKGHMDALSKTKLKRMALYYPQIRVEVIDYKAYRAIAKEAAREVPNWE